MEDFNVYEGIMDGLREAVAYKQGDHSNCKVSIREISVPAYKAADVIRTRHALNLTQNALACAMGVSPKTVEEWEAGEVEPSDLASRFLYLLYGDHSLVQRLMVI